MKNNELQQPSLHSRHVALEATLGDVGGWEMPISYGDVAAEWAAVRRRAGACDLSHLGRIRIRGDGALANAAASVSSRNRARASAFGCHRTPAATANV